MKAIYAFMVLVAVLTLGFIGLAGCRGGLIWHVCAAPLPGPPTCGPGSYDGQNAIPYCHNVAH